MEISQNVVHELAVVKYIFFFSTKTSKFSVKVKSPMGEQLQARPITEQDFISLQSMFIVVTTQFCALCRMRDNHFVTLENTKYLGTLSSQNRALSDQILF